MRQIILIFYCLYISATVFGQKHKTIEPAILECHYKYNALKDTLQQIPFSEDLIILRMGKNLSQIYSYHTFQGDSLLSTPEGVKIAGRLTMEGVRTKDFTNVPGVRIMQEYIYKHYPQNKVTTISSIDGMSYMTFEEEYEPQNWSIQDSIKNILDYNCQLAECDFRGRKYYAWFTPEISINEGPWKFNGLPGLIMEVYDKNSHYHFEIVSILKEDLQPVTLYNFSNKKLTKTTRSKYLKALRNYKENNIQIIKASTGIDLNPNNEAIEKHLLYDFLEKDY